MDKDLDLIYKNLFLDEASPRHISAFISGAEKIGTSWCALTLAHALNLQKKKVLLVDGNGNLSNISSYIPLNDPHYLEEYINGNKTLNQLITAYKNKDFNILTATAGNNYLADFPLGRIHVFAEDLSILAKNYGQTIIDLGTDTIEQNLSLYQLADNLFIMCSDRNSDLVKTLETIRFINKHSLRGKCHLIINRVASFEDGYKIYKELHKATERNGLNAPNLLGIVRFDTRIRDTIRNKEMLLSRYPSSEAAVDICNIAQKLVSEIYYD